MTSLSTRGKSVHSDEQLCHTLVHQVWLGFVPTQPVKSFINLSSCRKILLPVWKTLLLLLVADNFLDLKSMKMAATDAERLCSATNCARSTSDFTIAEDDCGFTAKNDVIGMCVFSPWPYLSCVVRWPGAHSHNSCQNHEHIRYSERAHCQEHRQIWRHWPQLLTIVILIKIVILNKLRWNN